MRAEQSLQIRDDPPFSTQILGIKEHTFLRDVAAFGVTEIVRPAPLPPLFGLITNHEVLYILQQVGKDLSESCRFKVDLRMAYKFQPPLHLKLFYSTNTEVLLLMLQGGELAVFNEEVYLLGVQALQCCDYSNSLKHCLDWIFIEKEGWREVRKIKKGSFVFLFVDSIEWHEVEIDTNHKLSKFKPSYKLHLNQLSKTVIDKRIRHPLQFSLHNYRSKTHLASEQTNDYIYIACNCSSLVFFYIITKATMSIEDTVMLKIVGEGPGGVTSIQVGTLNQRAILGMSNGFVKIYSLKIENRGKTLFTIQVSESPIQDMLWLKDKHQLLAYSKDNYLSLINFNSMAVQQKWRTGVYSKTVFLSQRSLLGLGNKSNSIYNMQSSRVDQFSKQLIHNQLDLFSDFIVELNSNIVAVSESQGTRLLQLQDNSLVILKKEEEKLVSMRTYLPPKCVSVQSISRNIFSQQQQYWLLTDRSEVYKYSITGHTLKVTGVLGLMAFTDQHMSQQKYRISCLQFAKITVPIGYDSQVTQNQYPPNILSHQQFQPMFLGTASGDLLMVSLKDPTLIRFRLKKLNSPVLYIHEFGAYFDGDCSRGLVVVGSAHHCLIFQVTSSRLPLQLFRMELVPERVRPVNLNWLSLCSEGHFNLFYFKNQLDSQECQCYMQEHYNPGLVGDSTISCLSYSREHHSHYITTGYSLGQIILWKVMAIPSEQGYLLLLPLHLIENSKEEPTQQAFFNSDWLCFNLGRFFVRKILRKQVEKEGECQHKIGFGNIKIERGKMMVEKSIAKVQKEKRERFREEEKRVRREESRGKELPLVRARRKGRASSLGGLGVGKVSQIFHFPDTHLLRSLISKRLIE